MQNLNKWKESYRRTTTWYRNGRKFTNYIRTHYYAHPKTLNERKQNQDNNGYRSKRSSKNLPHSRTEDRRIKDEMCWKDRSKRHNQFLTKKDWNTERGFSWVFRTRKISTLNSAGSTTIID